MSDPRTNDHRLRWIERNVTSIRHDGEAWIVTRRDGMWTADDSLYRAIDCLSLDAVVQSVVVGYTQHDFVE